MQPTYMPWVGYFAMIDEVDVFVFLDDVQLNKRSWQTRNRIKEYDGKELMLTMPLLKKRRDETRICDSEFANDDWRAKHLVSIKQNYRKSAFFEELFPWLEKVYSYDTRFLSDFNINMIVSICEYLGIETNMIKSSDLSDTPGKKDELLLNICKKKGINVYLSAKGSSEYIEKDRPGGAFFESGIRIEYQNYAHPVYNQKGKEFMPYMGIVDLLFNCGRESLSIIRSGVRVPYSSESVLEINRDY